MNTSKFLPFCHINIGDKFRVLDKGVVAALCVKIGNTVSPHQPVVQTGDPFERKRVNAALLEPMKFEGHDVPAGQVVCIHDDEAILVEE